MRQRRNVEEGSDIFYKNYRKMKKVLDKPF